MDSVQGYSLELNMVAVWVRGDQFEFRVSGWGLVIKTELGL